MKKFILFFILLFGLTTPVLANTTLNEVKEIPVYISTAEGITAYMNDYPMATTTNLLGSNESYIKIFISGSTGVQFDLPMLVAISNVYDTTYYDETTKAYLQMLTNIDKHYISQYFDDESVMAMVQMQTGHLSIAQQVSKSAEIIDIVNQLRSLYRKLNFVNFEDVTNSSYYVFDMQNMLDQTNGQLLFGITTEGQAVLVYDSRLPIPPNVSVNQPIPNTPNVSVNPEIPGGSSGNNSWTGGYNPIGNNGNGGNNGNSGNNGNGPNNTVQQAPLKKYENRNNYNGEFAAVDVRSAEISVIEKCWSESCGHIATENIITEESKGLSVPLNISLDTSSNAYKEYTFNLAPYYAMDTEYNNGEVLALLTDYNLEKFKKTEFVENVLNKIVLYKTKKVEKTDGDTVKETFVREVDNGLTEAARSQALAQLEQLANNLRLHYKKIDVIFEGGDTREFYVHVDFLTDIPNTVFAQNAEEKLIAIKTDTYNNVFKPLVFNIAGHTCVGNLEEGDMQYRKADGYFYLCENCAKCAKCDCNNLVAIGNQNGTVYFSNYCGEHACWFVWDIVVDTTNSGETKEGLKCVAAKTNNYYCDQHTCDACGDAIVGESKSDSTVNGDPRKTGSSSEDDYSAFCEEHKCRAKDCDKQRIGENTSSDTHNGKIVSDKYCADHCTGCRFYITGKTEDDGFCNADVVDATKMLCQAHINVVNTNAKFEDLAYQNSVLSQKLANPNGKTIVFFAGQGDRINMEATKNHVTALKNKGVNVICVTIKNPRTQDDRLGRYDEWDAIYPELEQHLDNLVKQGLVDPDNISFEGFSNGAHAAADMAERVQDRKVTNSNGTVVGTYDVALTVIDGIYSAGFNDVNKVGQMTAKGIDVSVYYSLHENEKTTQSYAADLANAANKIGLTLLEGIDCGHDGVEFTKIVHKSSSYKATI